MKAIIYCRVSSPEQAKKGYSLASQERECKEFARDNSYIVDRVFIEGGESAKTADRTELTKLIKYAVQNKKKISALIVWKFDRFARNLGNQITLIEQFNKLGVRVLSTTENNEKSPSGELIRNIIGAFSQYENEVKAERTTKGMEEALKEDGRWCWRAPIGYDNARDVKGKAIIVPSAESYFIKECFKMAETGLYKQVDIAKHLKQKGLKKITANMVNRILRNPIYCGWMKVKWFDELIEGIHEPLVTKETFSKVQMILDGKKPSITPHIRNNPHFPLRNFIRCPKCGQKLTGGYSTGRKGRRYPYYHCRTKGCSLNARKEPVETKFYEHLKSIQPEQKTLGLFESIVKDVWVTKQSDRVKRQNRIKLALQTLAETRDRIESLRIDDKIDDDTFQRRLGKVRSDIEQKNIELNGISIELDDIDGCLEYCKYFLSNVADLWRDASLNLKQRFQTLIFPDRIYYEQESFRTTRTALIFKQLQPKSLPESYLVAPTGFEPVLPP